ncbi:MAG TPA: GGDEF domain-containing protein [Pseudomonadales bacterium]|nr:GGDEF domain-containing protein [Pseudomonadales bacterium]
MKLPSALRASNDEIADFRVRATFGAALTALVVLLPFAINNFVQGRTLLGAGALAIVAALALNGLSLLRGRPHPLLNLLALLPAVLLFLILAFREQGVVGALWCYPAILAFYAILPERQAWIANIGLLTAGIGESWIALDPSVALRVTATLAAVSVFAAFVVRAIATQQARLEQQAVTDPLTGLANRVRLEETLGAAVERSRRTGLPMTLLALDLDHFKAINDDYGHAEGDAVLRATGAFLLGRVRRSDQAFRIGGEEFLVMLFGTDRERGLRVADALRASIAALELVPDRSVTVSIGLATLAEGEDWRSWMKRSDEQLYVAKGSGRDMVVG